MSQYQGGQPPQDPYYGRPPSDPYSAPQAGDPYYAPPAGDPYAPPPQPSQDPYYGQAPADPYAQQAQNQAWLAQQQQQQQPYWPTPDAQQQGYWQSADQQQAYWAAPGAPPASVPPPAQARSGGGTGAAIAGIFLVFLGVWFLFRDEISLDIGRTWPVIAVALGTLMVIAAFIPRRQRS